MKLTKPPAGTVSTTISASIATVSDEGNRGSIRMLDMVLALRKDDQIGIRLCAIRWQVAPHRLAGRTRHAPGCALAFGARQQVGQGKVEGA